MTWLSILLLQPLVLLALYAIVIQYRRESLPQTLRKCLYYACAPVLVYDALQNLTLFTLVFWDRPRTVNGKFEYTLSDRLSRLVRSTGWRYWIAHPIRLVLDYLDPTGKHIE